MNLKKAILTANNCYKAGKIIVPKGIMVHSTGANNPNLRRYVAPDDGLLGQNTNGNDWNRPTPENREVCVHAFIGKLKDGGIASYQTLPWNMRGWHAGGAANDTHISFEICEDDLLHRDYFDIAYKEALELTAYLCKLYSLNETNVICHSEGHSMGIATGHSDVMHWFPKHGKSMDTFRSDLRELLKKGSAIPPAPDPGVNPPSAGAPDGSLYRVQMGAFQKRENAEALQKKLSSEGYTTIIKES